MTYSSVSADGLDDLLAAIQTAQSRLDSFTGQTVAHSVQADMNELEVTSDAMRTLGRLQDWTEEEAVPSLRRRLNLARGLEQQHPDAPMVEVDDAAVVMTSEEAEGEGRELASKFEEMDGLDDDDLGDLMNQLEEIAHDPDAMSGFYAELGPELSAKLAGTIPDPVADVGPDAQRYLELMSIGLGSATMDETKPDDWYEMESGFAKTTDDPNVAWGRLALLQYGDFSGAKGFVQRTIKGAALDEFVQDDWDDPANVSSRRLTTNPDGMLMGLPAEISVLAFQTLGDYPQMARETLTSYEDFPLSDFVDRIALTAGGNGERVDRLVDSFGRTIEVAVGAVGDPPRTEHSPEEEAFAFEFIDAVGSNKQMPGALRDSLANVGAAYVDEMVAGAYVDPGERVGSRDSSMTNVPNDFPEGSGLDPAFYLSPEITYRFMGHFQDQLETSKPFDEAMGALHHEKLGAAIRADHAGEGDGTHVEQVMKLFGGAAKMNYMARRDYAADFDAQKKATKAAVTKVISAGLSLIPVPGKAHVAYWGFQLLAAEWMNSDNNAESEEEKVVGEHATKQRIRWYLTVEVMIDHGVGADAMADIPAGLVDDNGELKPMTEIFADENMSDEFYVWVNKHPELNARADAADDGWGIGANRIDSYITSFKEDEKEERKDS